MVLNTGGWTILLGRNVKRYHSVFIQIQPISKAREQKLEAKQNINNGLDPSALRKAEKEQVNFDIEQEQRLADGQVLLGSFEEVAREWGELTVNGWQKKNERVVG